MTDCTVAAPVRATQAPARRNATPSPVSNPAASTRSEVNTLALKAAEILQTVVLSIICDENDSPRTLKNTHFEEVDRLLGRLLAPGYHDRNDEDPADGDIRDYLALISSELAGAVEVLDRCKMVGIGQQVILSATAHHALELADRLLLAYSGLPGTLEDLRALTTYAGAKPSRNRPTPPIRRVDQGPGTELTSAQYRIVLEVIAGHAFTLQNLLRTANTHLTEYEGCLMQEAAKIIAGTIGGMADSAIGGKVSGGHDGFHYGTAFSDEGRAGAA